MTLVSLNPPTPLSGAEKRFLRSLAHILRPVVQIGKDGLSEGVIQATLAALEQHELIKVSINGESPTERKSGAASLSASTGSHVVQVIGRVLILYRQHEKEPQIQLPRPKKKRKMT